MRHGTNPYKRGDVWHFFYIDASGRKRRESAKTKNKRVAEAILTERRGEVDKRRAGLLADYGESGKRPLDEFVKDYVRDLKASGKSPQYVDEAAQRIRFLIGEAKLSNLRSVKDAEPRVRLAFVELSEKRSAKTVANYRESLTTFGAWLQANSFWECNPFVFVKKGGKRKDADRIFRRRQLSLAEVEQLAAAALVRHAHAYAKSHGGRPSPRADEFAWIGKQRAVTYWLAATTGLRASEIDSLRWEDLHLEGAQPFFVLSGKFTKNRNDAKLPLQPFMAAVLTDLRKDRGKANGKPVEQGDKVLPIPDRIAEHVRRDAMHAGLIPTHRPADQRLDFHSLRHSTVRILRELGVPVEVVQRVLRHVDVRLTLQTYGSSDDDRMTKAMGSIVPVPAMFRDVCTLACTSDSSKATKIGTGRDKQRSNEGGASHGKRTG